MKLEIAKLIIPARVPVSPIESRHRLVHVHVARKKRNATDGWDPKPAANALLLAWMLNKW